MGEIKSAFEKAMERVERMEVPQEKVLRLQHVPEGERLAAKYLKEEYNLSVELDKYDEGVKKYLIEGAQEVLLRNIGLPQHDFAKKNSKRAMEGIKRLKRDKASLENVYSKIRRIFHHYEQEGEMQRRQARDMLKQDFERKLQQAMQLQLGSSANVRVNVENLPEFQEQWRRTAAQLDAQYYKLLDEYKQEIMAIS